MLFSFRAVFLRARRSLLAKVFCGSLVLAQCVTCLIDFKENCLFLSASFVARGPSQRGTEHLFQRGGFLLGSARQQSVSLHDGAAVQQTRLDRDALLQLRRLTGAPLRECSSALREGGNDLRKAILILRRRGSASYSKSVTTATLDLASKTKLQLPEGAVCLVSKFCPSEKEDGGGVERAALVRMGCLTDFVANTNVFRNATQRAAVAAVSDANFVSSWTGRTDTDSNARLREVLKLRIPTEARSSLSKFEEEEAQDVAAETVGEDLALLSSIVGETVSPAEVAVREAEVSKGQFLASYLHKANTGDEEAGQGCGRLGVIVQLEAGKDLTKKDPPTPQSQPHLTKEKVQLLRAFGVQLCLHIASCRPLAVDADDLPADLLAQEREAARESLLHQRQIAAQTGKKVVALSEERMRHAVEGKMNKFFRSVALLQQPWALSPDDAEEKTVRQMLLELQNRLGGLPVRVVGFDLLRI